MNIRVTIFFALFFVLTSGNNKGFEVEFKYEISAAKEQYKLIEKQINSTAKKHKTDSLIISAIVFPELMRYSIFSDFFETKILEYYYIEKGAEAADFSIGIFQMKPSFIEQLEAEVNNYDSLRKYNFISQFKAQQIQQIREERLRRLKDVSWQITYINCFYNLIEAKFQNLIFKNKEDKLKFYASAYNHGFNCSASEINKWISIKSYPHGYGNKKSNYCYADVSWYFYSQLIKRKI